MNLQSTLTWLPRLDKMLKIIYATLPRIPKCLCLFSSLPETLRYFGEAWKKAWACLLISEVRTVLFKFVHQKALASLKDSNAN